MPTIPYTIQKSVQRLVNGRNRWFVEYETIFIDASDEVAAFLKKNNKREQRYQWKIKKQKQDAKIHTEFSLDEIKTTAGGDEYLVADLIEDNINPENFSPIEINIDKEEREEQKKKAEQLATMFDKVYSEILTKKQYEVWKYHEEGYCASDIARLLNIDESSVRERLKNAKKRIENYKPNK